MSKLESKVEEALRAEMSKGRSAKAPTKEKKEVIKEEFSLDTMPKGSTLFSELFGFTPVMGDFGVKVFDSSDWDDSMMPFMQEFDDGYVWQGEAVVDLVLAIENGDFTMMSGPTGSGKSTLVQNVCSKLNRPFIRFNGRGDMEGSSLFGQLTAEDGSTVWRDGPFTEAVKQEAVCLFDEYTVIPPEINMGLQWLVEHKGSLLLADKPGDTANKLINPHKEFRLICADNTKGLGDEFGSFAATTVQNTAFIDRFQTAIELDYLTKDHEVSILKNKVAGLSDSIAQKMVKMAGLVRTSYAQQELPLTMSPRTLINWGEKTVQRKGTGNALNVCFLKKLSGDDVATVKGFYSTVFGRTL